MKLTSRKVQVAAVTLAAAGLVGGVGVGAADALEPSKQTTVGAQSPYACIYQVTGNGVRLRTRPSSSAAVIGTLNRGDRVRQDAASPGEVYNYRYVWSYRHKHTGWVSSSYLRRISCNY